MLCGWAGFVFHREDAKSTKNGLFTTEHTENTELSCKSDFIAF